MYRNIIMVIIAAPDIASHVTGISIMSADFVENTELSKRIVRE